VTYFGDLLAYTAVFGFVVSLSILIGAYGEARWNLLSILVTRLRNGRQPPLELSVSEGDPGLIHWLERQRPSLARPDLECREAFQAWQTSLRSRLLELFDMRDIAAPVEVRTQSIRSTLLAGGITRLFMTFASFDGTKIPAYLFLPPAGVPRPGIIVLHGHVEAHEQGITQTGGLVDSYHHGCALELAKAGYVTLAMEFRGFGYLGAQVGAADHHLTAYNALLGGSFLKSMLTKDIRYALAFMQSLKEVVPSRIGVTGVSYGAEVAVTYGALDERIKVVVSQGFGGELGGQRGLIGSRRWAQDPFLSHLIPGHNNYMFEEDVFLLTAPRAMLGVWGSADFYGNRSFFPLIKKAYERVGALERIAVEIVPGDHEYFIGPALEFFGKHL
jgi:dienelactone hydrolase